MVSQRASEDTELMVIVTQATLEAEARGQRGTACFKTTLQGQGPLRRSTAEFQGPTCREPCPVQTSGPQR